MTRRIDEIYSTNSQWLKAKDLEGRDCNCRIGEVSEHTFQDPKGDRLQVVLTFNNLPEKLAEKQLGLNVTNAMTITELYGPEPDTWIGRYITLFPTKTRNKEGNWVDCIRVRNVTPQRLISNGMQKPPASPQQIVRERPNYKLHETARPQHFVHDDGSVTDDGDEVPF